MNRLALLVLLVAATKACQSNDNGGWTEFQGSWYHANPKVLAFHQARDACRSMGGDLVKITSKDENEFVYNLVREYAGDRQQVWIGLHALAKKFQWLDGSAATYTNWAPHEPNNVGSKEDCGHMWTNPDRAHKLRQPKKWNDTPCGVVKNFENGFVCERHFGDTWRKLNGPNTVCFEAKGNRPGQFKFHGLEGFVTAFMLKYRSGYVSCHSGNNHKSHWGCGNSKKYSLNVYVTSESNNILAPKKAFSLSNVGVGWYGVEGFHSRSETLVLQHGFCEPLYIKNGQQFRLWYAEDLYNKWEHNNHGRVCADVYASFFH